MITITDILALFGAVSGSVAAFMALQNKWERRFNLEITTSSNKWINDAPDFLYCKNTSSYSHFFDNIPAKDIGKYFDTLEKWLRIINKSDSSITILSLHIGKFVASDSKNFPQILKPYEVFQKRLSFITTDYPCTAPTQGKNILTVVTSRKIKNFLIDITY